MAERGGSWGVAFSATLHCLTGCAIGEVLGMVIGTAAGLSNGATVAISVVLAFVFGYSLTSLPLLRSGLALSAVIPIALASDTVSIAIMELVDNAIILLIPGAMDASLTDPGVWAALAAALVIAGAAALPVNRWLIARGRGHGWRASGEMAAAMLLPTFAAIALLWAHAAGSGALMAAEHVAMLVSMLAVMLLRPAEYGHGHVRRDAVPA